MLEQYFQVIFLKVFLFIGLFISGACITVGILTIAEGEFGSGIMITGVFGGLFFIFIKKGCSSLHGTHHEAHMLTK